MKPLVKCKVEDLKVGEFYLAYSSQSKMLSSNGKGGVVVQLMNIVNGQPEVKVWLDNGRTRTMRIARLDERKDCFMLLVNSDLFSQVKLKIGNEGVFAWPKFTERMKKAKEDGVDLEFVSIIGVNDRYPAERVDGTLTFMVNTKHDNTLTYLNHYQISVNENMLARVCAAEELEERKRQEVKAKIEEMKEGGARLTVGKMEFGLSMLPKIEELRKKFSKSCKENPRSCASFWVLIGDGKDIKREYKYSNAPCHAGICPTLDVGEERMFILSSSVKKDYFNGACGWLINSGAAKSWIDYLVNRSPYADMFTDKDYESILELGYVVNCNAPSNAVSAALTATRQIWEYPARVVAFHMLKEHINENLAYVMCMSASGDVRNGVLETLTWNNQCTSHTPFNIIEISDLGVVSYILGASHKCNEDITKSQRYSYPNMVHDLHEFCDKKTRKKNSLFEELKRLEIPEVKVNTDNPFEIPKTEVDVAIDVAVECAKKWCKKLGVSYEK